MHPVLAAWAVRAAGRDHAAVRAEVDAYFGDGDREDCGIVPPPCGGCYRCLQLQGGLTVPPVPVYLQHAAAVALRGGQHVPVQLGTRDEEGQRTHAPPGDVCAGCSDTTAGRWVPVSQCPAAAAALDELDTWLRSPDLDTPEPEWSRALTLRATETRS